MKRLFAFLAAFVLIAFAGATWNIANATPASAPDLTATETAILTTTPSETFENPTATPTATEELCPPPPIEPELIAPAHHAVFKGKTRIKLRWSEVECANKYRILVRRGSRSGEPVARGHTTKTKAFVELEPGYSYFWNVKSCINKQCRRSNTRKFTLPPPPTPTPTATPTVTNTPVATNTSRATSTRRPVTPAGTPVPGNPPTKLNDYKGPSVYLSDQPSPLFYYDCSFKWGDYRKGLAIHTLTLWFYPNEGVGFESRTLPGALVQKSTFRANSEGIVEVALDTSSWPGEHYHLTFTGQSSRVVYCGHFQLIDFPTIQESQEHGPHTREELDGMTPEPGTDSE